MSTGLAQLVMHRGTRGSIESAFPGGVLKKTADGVRVGIHNSKRRKSETADLTLAGRLLVAQEVERAHIARERTRRRHTPLPDRSPSG
jgi:hypothetical protein